MEKSLITLFVALFLVSACVFYPVMPESEVAARRIAQAIELLPTVTQIPEEATATAVIEATAQVIATEEASQVACEIKVNVSRDDIVYHMPGMAYYDRVKVDFSQGDFWACDETEAIAAGARKSSR